MLELLKLVELFYILYKIFKKILSNILGNKNYFSKRFFIY